MRKSRTKNVQINIISSFIMRISIIVLQFLSRMFFVRILGANMLGINGLFSNIISVLSLADLGMVTVMMYALYEPLAQNNTVKIGKLITFFKKIYILIASIIGIVGILLIPFLKYIINLENTVENITIYYVLFLINTIISYLFVYRTSLIEADQKAYIVNKYNIIFQLITFIFQIIILLLFQNYILYIVVGILISLINNIVLNHIALKIYPYLKNNHGDLGVEDRTKIFKNIKSLFLYKIGSVVQGNTDNILISIFVGTVVVGYYSNYYMIVISITGFVSLIFSSIKASLGNMIAENVGEEKKHFMFNVLEFVCFWITGFCSICFMVLFNDFIYISFGQEYIMDFSIVIVIILSFYTSNIRQSVWAYRETTGIFNKTKYITLITSSINLILSLLLGYEFGLVGILGATIIARMIYAFWKEPIILYREVFNSSSKEYFVRYFKNIIILIFVSMIVLILEKCIKVSNIYIDFIYKIILCTLIPNCMFVIIFFKTKEFKYMYSIINSLARSIRSTR